MARGRIQTESEWTEQGWLYVKIRKEKGKLTLDECHDALVQFVRDGNYGGYAAFTFTWQINTDMEGSGWFDDEPDGDVQVFSMITQGDQCPVCRKIAPPYQYCPNCGHDWMKEV